MGSRQRVKAGSPSQPRAWGVTVCNPPVLRVIEEERDDA